MLKKSTRFMFVIPIAFLLACPSLLIPGNLSNPENRDEIDIALTKKSIGVDFVGGHWLCFRPDPGAPLILPETGKSADVRFIDIYVGFKQGETSDPNDLTAWTMVVPDEHGETLYIDENMDHDLTNDGGPCYFPSGQNRLIHTITNVKNLDQKVDILLQRNADPNAPVLVDENGDLLGFVVDIIRENIPDYEGRKGTFYYDETLNLSYAMIQIDDENIKIGMMDWECNGLYNDEADLLVIEFLDKDLHRVKKESVKPDEIFRIGNDRYKISHVDPLGREIRMMRTDDPVPFHYTRKLEDLGNRTSKGMLDSTFWDLELSALDSQMVDFSRFKNQYVLLNFWGEWCRGCIMEIPALVDIYNRYPKDKLQILGVLKTVNPDIARKIITKNKMNWPQIMITGELQRLFQVDTYGYPANILIFPDGKTYILSNAAIVDHIPDM